MTTSFGQAGACSDVSQCNIQNVKVECGVTTRRKRDTTSNQNTGTIPLTVSFSLQIPLSGDLNTSVDINQTSVQISKEVLTVLSKVDMTLNVSGMVIRTDPSKPPQFQLSRLVCEEGQVQSGVMCGKGIMVQMMSFSIQLLRRLLSSLLSFSRQWLIFDASCKIFSTYSQLSPCGHPAITDTPIIRTAAKSPAKTSCRRLTEINSRYYGLSLMRTPPRGPYSVRYKRS